MTADVKYKNKKKGKRKDAKAEPEADAISRRKVVRVCVGMAMLLFALFMVASFSSYLYSGASDSSYCESPAWGSETVDSSYRVQNVCGKLGVRLAYFFLDSGFGVSSYAIPVFLFLLGLNLIGSFRFNLFKDFVKLALLMVWLSVVLAAVADWIPHMEESHINLGGNHGKFVHSWLNDRIGVGEYGLIGLSVIFVLIYLSVRTVDRITEFFRFRRLRSLRDKLNKLRHRNENAPCADADGEDWAGGQDGEADSRAGEGESGTDGEGDAGTSNATEIDFTIEGMPDGALGKDGGKSGQDADSGLADPDEPQGEPSDEEKAADGTGGNPSPNPATDTAAGTEAKTIPTGTGKTPVASPDFTIATVTATEKGTGEIQHGTLDLPYDPRASLSHYEFPPLSLLDSHPESVPSIDMAEQQANKDRIIKVLKSFSVEISTIRATIGPTITLYEITPAEGTRIAKIRNLEDDIALSLAAEGIRIIAPIPGKGTIGIEVPNKKKCIVSMESVLNSKTFQESTMELPCALGKTITNEVYMVDLAKAPHLLVAGATGMGKSVGLNAIVTSLLYKKHPSELKMVMVDPKKVEFSIYSPIANQFLAKLEDEEDSIITENKRVVKTLNGLCKLMDDRYILLKKAEVRNIKEYNAKFKARRLNPEEGHEYMPYYVVIIDEFGDLIMTAGKEIELPICRIAQLARAVGIHMIIATQRPTTHIITGTIKANFPARMAFKVAAMMDSRIILDRPGANQLIGRGDMLYLQGNEPVRVQCAFVDTPEVTRICKFISEQQKFPSQTFLPEPPTEEGESESHDVDLRHLDPMFGDVARMVVSNNAGSTSVIQRKFSIGYNRAGRIMDQLEKAGIVGPQMGSKPREVLISDLLSLDELLNSIGAS